MRKRAGNNGAFCENNRSRAVSFTKAFSRMVAVIPYIRFDSDSLGAMVVNSSVGHNLRCAGVATFRAKGIELDLSGYPTYQELAPCCQRRLVVVSGMPSIAH
jgi:hypothetical protein